MRTLLITLVIVCLSYTSSFANGYEVFPYPMAWSADSRTLAVVLPYEFSGSSTGGPLAIYDRMGRERAYFDWAVFSSPTFNPDTGELAVVADGALLVGPRIPLEGFETVVEDSVLDCKWMFGVEQQVLVYSAGERFGTADVYIIWEDGYTSNETVGFGEVAFTGLNTTPTGEFMVFTRMPGEEGDFGYERLYAYDFEAGAFIKVANEQAREWDYHESNAVFPFDDWVIFQRGGWGDWNLYRADLKTGKEYLELPDAQQPSVSAGGAYLAFTRRDYSTKVHTEYDWEIPPAVWLLDRESGVTFQVSTPGKVAQYPAISPDGERLAWLEEKPDGSYKVIIRGVKGLLNLRGLGD